MKVYHGTSNSSTILKNDFDLDKCGSGWGLTYGPGIYFARTPVEAATYGKVLECEINYNPFYLEKDYSVSSRKHRRELNKLKELAIKQKKTCFVTKNKLEIIVFDPVDIISQRLF
jgi:hypothetical protein